MVFSLPLFLLLLLAPSSNAEFSVTTLPSLNKLFEPQKEGWLGADSSASVCIKTNCYFIWADTLVGSLFLNSSTTPAPSTINRNITGMPHNSLSLNQLNVQPKFLDPRVSNRPRKKNMGWFSPDDFPNSYYWPINGVHDATINKSLIMSAMRVSKLGFLNVTSTDLIIVNDTNIIAHPDDPTWWEFRTVTLPKGEEIYSTLGLLIVEDFLYIMGNQNAEKKAILSRLKLSSLLNSNNTNPSIEYLTESGSFVTDPENNSELHRLFDRPTSCSEGDLNYNEKLNIFYFVCLQATDPNILFASSSNLCSTKSWATSTIYTVPEELSNGFPYTAYAAKSHPELSDDGETIIISYNTNSAGGFDGLQNSTIAYHPRFLELTITTTITNN